MSELNAKTLLVSANGGTLDYVSADGELLFSVAVPAGRISASEYLEICPSGAKIEIATGLAAVQPKNRLAIQRPENLTDSGANPDFQPTSADRLQRQMRLAMSQMQADQRRLDARFAALAQIERMPQAAVAAPVGTQEPQTGGEVVE
jgi:hypothetical protein